MTVKVINSDIESQDSLEKLKTKIQNNSGISIGQQSFYIEPSYLSIDIL